MATTTNSGRDSSREPATGTGIFVEDVRHYVFSTGLMRMNQGVMATAKGGVTNRNLNAMGDRGVHVERAGTNWQIIVEVSHVALIDAAWAKGFVVVPRSLAVVGRTPAEWDTGRSSPTGAPGVFPLAPCRADLTPKNAITVVGLCGRRGGVSS